MKNINRRQETRRVVNASPQFLPEVSVWIIVIGMFLAGSARPVNAQVAHGRVSGFVTDPLNAVVPGAKVTLHNVSTGVASISQTDSSGHYLFNYVLPGNYTLAVEHAGFRGFLQENITVLAAGDVTVNAKLAVGAVSQTVTVTAAPAGVQFNTTNMSMTVQQQLVKTLPIEQDNPYSLALLDPAVVNTYWTTRFPFYMWSAGYINIGGPTSDMNDVELDGMSTLMDGKSAYTPPMDSTQQVSVQENSIDAQYGYTGGGTLLVDTKSGTNQVHGTVFYLGDNPATNALANRVTRSANVFYKDEWGASVGFPIKRNKIFNFGSYEQWRVQTPNELIATVPTVAERNGDFSQALTPQGAQRTIYNPFTTQFNPTTDTVTRQPFPGNIIPTDMMDSAGLQAVKNMWMPNGPGTDLSGANNFQVTFPWWDHYYNFMDRVDYDASNKWRFFGRYGLFRTQLDNPNFGGTADYISQNGGVMNSYNLLGDALYTVSSSTILDFRFNFAQLQDDYRSSLAQVPQSVWASFWPNGWYNGMLAANAGEGLYYPSFTFNGNGSAPGTLTGWWQNHEHQASLDVSVTHDAGINNMSAGLQYRYVWEDDNASAGEGGFTFNSIDTGNTFLSNYNPAQSGDMYASALLGVVDTGDATIMPNLPTRMPEYALYFQDNIKAGRKITLNLGLRWEGEPTTRVVGNWLNGGAANQTLDLNTPIQPLVALANSGQLQMPSQVTAIAQIPYKFNGAMQFTSGSNPRMFNAPMANFLPRAGIAIALNNKTAIRVGYGRYMNEISRVVNDETDFTPYYGFNATTQVISPIEGVPQTLLSDPFPATNPLLLPTGTKDGAYTGLGESLTNLWNGSTFKNTMNDRFNFSIQRQMPQGFTVSATYFMAFMHNVPYIGYNLNQINPELGVKYQGLISQAVSNPFYNLLPVNEMPGTLRTEPTVSASQLLVPYPQYGSLTQYGWPGISNHYYAFQFQAERPMSHGVIFLAGYNYNQDYQSQFFNSLDNYNNHTTMLDAGTPRNNLTASGTWVLPIGRGRSYLSNLNPILNGIIGGWSTSQILYWHSGDLLEFGQATVTGNPLQNVPAGHYFNPSVFEEAPAFSIRANPWYYPGLRGPAFWELDSTLVKTFSLTERVGLQFRLEFYNMPNTFMPANPVLTVGAGNMGQSIAEAAGNLGRVFQYRARITF